MFTCTLCHFDCEQDDVVMNRADGQVICLSCYNREVGIAKMPKLLMREIEAAMASLTPN